MRGASSYNTRVHAHNVPRERSPGSEGFVCDLDGMYDDLMLADGQHVTDEELLVWNSEHMLRIGFPNMAYREWHTDLVELLPPDCLNVAHFGFLDAGAFRLYRCHKDWLLAAHDLVVHGEDLIRTELDGRLD